MIEAILAFATNFSFLAVIVALICCVCTFITFQEDPKLARRFFKGAIVCAVIGCIPSVDEMWKVRIALIKFELASPENVKKSADVIY